MDDYENFLRSLDRVYTFYHEFIDYYSCKLEEFISELNEILEDTE